MTDEERKMGAVDVTPRLLADSLRRVLKMRGIAVGDELTTDDACDIAVLDEDASDRFGARVVIRLPGRQHVSGRVLVDRRATSLPVRDFLEFEAALDLMLPQRNGQ